MVARRPDQRQRPRAGAAIENMINGRQGRPGRETGDVAGFG
jgi:hypothetical protein